MTRSPSNQQQAIMDAIAASQAKYPTMEHTSVRALAGTGKTTTIEMCQSSSSGLNVCFNRVVRETFIKRMPSAINHTFNSLGHSIIAKNISGKVKFDAD